ncbi:MAG: DNA cytosine methyltransferase [Deltaproteobacteria bacterium]|nr:DNA cytosine methyltransferase [Deltaproteobacteria bacterium]
MNELSLFTGIGGGLLGSKLLGWRTIGYVEIDEYCQRVIGRRIADGVLDSAPIFGCVNKFLESGAAGEYRGFADVVTAGFPCQPFSVAGRREGERDDRNMWPQTIEVIRRVRPRYAFLENVPGLLADKYFGRILGDLAESGYNAKWKVISAAEMGATHLRDRIWIVAHASSEGRDEKNIAEKRQIARSAWWNSEPDVGRLAYGAPDDVERLKALGNAQVPAVAACAWEILSAETRF